MTQMLLSSQREQIVCKWKRWAVEVNAVPLLTFQHELQMKCHLGLICGQQKISQPEVQIVSKRRKCQYQLYRAFNILKLQDRPGVMDDEGGDGKWSTRGRRRAVYGRLGKGWKCAEVVYSRCFSGKPVRPCRGAKQDPVHPVCVCVIQSLLLLEHMQDIYMFIFTPHNRRTQPRWKTTLYSFASPSGYKLDEIAKTLGTKYKLSSWWVPSRSGLTLSKWT